MKKNKWAIYYTILKPVLLLPILSYVAMIIGYRYNNIVFYISIAVFVLYYIVHIVTSLCWFKNKKKFNKFLNILLLFEGALSLLIGVPLSVILVNKNRQTMWILLVPIVIITAILFSWIKLNRHYFAKRI